LYIKIHFSNSHIFELWHFECPHTDNSVRYGQLLFLWWTTINNCGRAIC